MAMNLSPPSDPFAPHQSAALLDAFSSRKILIVGDVMLDEYLWGDVRRICPEAPVPIVESRERSARPGGAANAAANVAALGGTAWLCGVTGNDQAGEHLRRALAEAGVEPDGLIACDDRPTTAKLRVIAHSQQVLRIDTEKTHPLSRDAADRLIAHVESHMREADALLLCDYAKGALSAEMTGHFIALARRRKLPVVVDPKGKDYSRYRGATVIKPNLHELETLLRSRIRQNSGLVPERDPISGEFGYAAGEFGYAEAVGRLTCELDGAAVLVTQGAEGMTLFEPGIEPWHQPAAGVRPVFDVTGAGDTVVSVLALALACGAPLRQGVQMANVAANVVVGKLGTAVVTREELRAAIGSPVGRPS